MNSLMARPFFFAVSLTSAFLLTLGGSVSHAADVTIKPGDKVITIDIRNGDELDQLLDWNLDIWSHHFGIGPVDVHVSVGELALIEAAGWDYKVNNPDLAASHSLVWQEIQQRRNMRGAGDFDNYKTFDEIVTFINDLATARPDLVDPPFSIGQSIEGRDIWVLRITGAGTGPKPAVFFHGLQHCREWITGPMVMYIADHLVNNYDTDPCIQSLLDRTEFYLAPCVNPDGYVHTWPPDDVRLWRKNRRNNGDGTFGVDLNRNWAFGWGGGGSSGVTTSEIYRGTAPFSEPETTALSNFISANPNIRAYMDYHSYSQLILWPFGNVCSEPSPPDDALFWNLGNTMQTMIQDVHGKYYEPGPICQTLYQASGGSVDWAYGTAGRIGFTIELRPNSSLPGFELPPGQIVPNCEENLPAILHLSRWATSGIGLNHSNQPAYLNAGEPTTLTVSITDLLETYVPGSGMLFYRFDAGEPFTAVPLIDQGGNIFSADLPSAPCGTTVEYFFAADGDGGFVGNEPDVCAGGISSYTAEVIETTFVDSFEAPQGWTTANFGATSGDWQRGIPVNDAGWAYDPVADADGSGQCYLTQNQLGNTDVDNGSVRLTSPTLDLTGGDVLVTYDYFLRLTNADGIDRLLVEIESNNGAGPWIEIAGHDTDGGLTWRHHEITEADLLTAGVTITSTMTIRFTANDDGTQSIVEAGLDAFAIVAQECSAVPCPNALGDMNGDTLIDGGDIQLLVEAMITSPFYNVCADMATPTGTLDVADVATFVQTLLTQ